MISIFVWNISCIRRLLGSLASLLVLVSLSVQADSIGQDDVHAWLKHNGPQPTQTNDGIYYVTGEFSTNFNSPSYALTKPDTSINDFGFKQSNKKIAKANERKLLRRLSDKLKVSLFSSSSRYSKHKVYINTVKQELVSKSRIGRAKYEVRVSEKQAEAHFRYTFR